MLEGIGMSLPKLVEGLKEKGRDSSPSTQEIIGAELLVDDILTSGATASAAAAALRSAGARKVTAVFLCKTP